MILTKLKSSATTSATVTQLTIQNNTKQYKTVQNNTRQYETIQDNTKQYKTVINNFFIEIIKHKKTFAFM